MNNQQLKELPENVLVSLDSLLSLRFKASKTFHKSYKKTEALISGNFASPFRGRGIDFSEVRLYQPGDDIRSMDWRVTARTGKPHTKLFTEERERPVFFVVDSSLSMQFGTRQAFKSVVAAKITALLAWSAISHGDRVGAVLFANDKHREIKPSGGKRGVLKLLKHLVDWNAENFQSAELNADAPMDDVAARLKRVARPGSMVYVISDFLNFDKKTEQYFSQISQHCDLVLINVYDYIEKYPPPPGNYLMSDGKDFGNLSTADKELREAIKEDFLNREEKLKRYSINRGMHCFSVCTTDDLQQVIRDQLTHKMLNAL